jgi:hypothetical protein
MIYAVAGRSQALIETVDRKRKPKEVVMPAAKKPKPTTLPREGTKKAKLLAGQPQGRSDNGRDAKADRLESLPRHAGRNRPRCR